MLKRMQNPKYLCSLNVNFRPSSIENPGSAPDKSLT